MNVLDLFKLNGKTALVTGCSRGIGKAMALALAEAGADIVGVSKSLGPGSEIEREVTALGAIGGEEIGWEFGLVIERGHREPVADQRRHVH